MNRIVPAVGLLCSFVFFSLPAATAQDRYDPEYDNRGNPRGFRNAQDLFDHIQSDVDQARRSALTHVETTSLLDRLHSELGELQREWTTNQYDRHQAGNVISALERVVGEGRLPSRDRDRFSDDLRKMREFAAVH